MSRRLRGFVWLPAALAALAFGACFAAFAWQLFAYQRNVRAWSEADLKSRAELTAATLEDPLKTLNFKAIQKVAGQLKADGLRLRITQGKSFFVTEGGNRTGFFDTCGEPYPADVACSWGVAKTGDFHVGIGRPVGKMLLPFYSALLVMAFAALVGVTGVLLFFVVIYRQRVRIRELKKVEQFRREFIADVSHEIKTPLTGILGAVDMLEGDSPLVPLIKRESVRLNGLVQSILDLARLEREGEILRRAATDLGELVREVTDAQRPLAEATGMTLALKCASGDLVANVDGQLLSQALANLIANAIRHSGTKDATVSLEVVGKETRIAVEDHGVGIPPEHAARIFERFHRVDPARAAETGGAGLGLSIVRRIAHLHGGDVTLTAVRPHGCRFTLTLPLGR